MSTENVPDEIFSPGADEVKDTCASLREITKKEAQYAGLARNTIRRNIAHALDAYGGPLPQKLTAPDGSSPSRGEQIVAIHKIGEISVLEIVAKRTDDEVERFFESYIGEKRLCGRCDTVEGAAVYAIACKYEKSEDSSAPYYFFKMIGGPEEA